MAQPLPLQNSKIFAEWQTRYMLAQDLKDAVASSLAPCAITDRTSFVILSDKLQKDLPGPSPLKSDKTYSATVYADLLKVRADGVGVLGTEAGHYSGGIRGAISGFSRKSRKRLLEKIAKIRDISGGHFVRLGYPDEVLPRDPKQVKRDIANLRKRIKRRYPDMGGLWRMEYQDRKSGPHFGQLQPHFHLPIFGITDDDLTWRLWLRDAWYEVVGSGLEKHRINGTHSAPIINRRHAMAYASKYAAKESGTLCDRETGEVLQVGRFWASFGKLDLSPSLIVRVSYQEFIQLRRLVRGWMKSKNRRYAKTMSRLSDMVGFSAFGLGDNSWEGWRSPFETTIMRMVVGGL